MKISSWTFVVAALLLTVGCAGIKSIYTEVPTDGIALIDYEGELTPEEVKDKDAQELIRTRVAEGYRLVGKAEFTVSGNQGWTEAMVKKGREVKAGKIDYIVRYDKTESGAAGQNASAVQMVSGPGWDTGDPDVASVTTAGNSSAPYTLSLECYVYHVYYFKKVRQPQVK